MLEDISVLAKCANIEMQIWPIPINYELYIEHLTGYKIKWLTTFEHYFLPPTPPTHHLKFVNLLLCLEVTKLLQEGVVRCEGAWL